MESIYGSITGVYSGSMAYDYKNLVTKDTENPPKHAPIGMAVHRIAK